MTNTNDSLILEVRKMFYHHMMEKADLKYFAFDYKAAVETSRSRKYIHKRYSTIPGLTRRADYTFDRGNITIHVDSDILAFLDSIKEVVWQGITVKELLSK
ncbi:unnamed protein product [marine sediment metagenome]|uniref:Uncharacterized protein n=1 Tax=marine sediment metagenome TaxID=412755 RepID=X0XC19_9ZZZZ